MSASHLRIAGSSPILKHPETNGRLPKDGADPVGSSPQEFGRFMQG